MEKRDHLEIANSEESNQPVLLPGCSASSQFALILYES